MCVSESELVIPALRLIKEAGDQGIKTSEIVKVLYIEFEDRLSDKDKSILANRKDPYFSQTVRNLKSHDAMQRRSIANYINRTWYITENGKDYLELNEDLFHSLHRNNTTQNEIKSIVNKNFEGLVVEEGTLSIKSVKHRVRSRSLANKKIEQFRAENNGELFCMACKFNFEDVYGDHGMNYIEIHHLTPVHTMNPSGELLPVEEALDKLAPLCSNCHRMVHKDRKNLLSVSDLKGILTS